MAKKLNRQKIVFQNPDNKFLYNFLIEQLGAINQRFDGVDQRFDGVDQRFDGVDQRFDGVDQRFDGVDKKFVGINQRFDGVDKKFDGVEKEIAESKKQFADFKDQYIADYKDLVELISDQLEKKADKTDIMMVLSRITQLSDKVDDIRANQITMQNQLDKHERILCKS